MRVGLLADTHGFLDKAIFNYFAECDEVWHAGDFGPLELLEELEAFKPLRGVWGNIDGEKVRAAVPKDAQWECDGLRVYMTHIENEPGVRARIAQYKPGLFICGHSHILKVTREPESNMLSLNPGAAGHHGWHKERTVLRFSIGAGKVGGLEVIQLGPRGRAKKLKE
jgi:putative phosphoesterase